ncbi:MAG: serine protease [Clostridia bacterium]|nr:serine protease [Clostridia bacterium]
MNIQNLYSGFLKKEKNKRGLSMKWNNNKNKQNKSSNQDNSNTNNILGNEDNKQDNNQGYYGNMSGDNFNGSSFSSPPTPPKKDKDNKNGLRVFLSLLFAIVVVCVIVVSIAFADVNDNNENKQTTTSSATENKDGAPSVDIKPTPSVDDAEESESGALSSIEVAKKASSSVIAVLSYQNSQLIGEGSGIVMGEDKDKKNTYIITCAHIINTAGTSVRIQTSDGTQHDADIVGFDSRTDVGVLRVSKTGFTAAEFGDSSNLLVGQQVYAIGNPGGTAFYGSFTSGVISAIDRLTSAGENGYSMSCIQHDAAINPGNSGGALVNEYGQVIGINSSKIADTEYEGMGFAIPITVAKDVIEDIIASGYVPNRPKLGITYSVVSYSQTYSMIVQMKGLPNGSIVIASIDQDSSIVGTQAKIGDLITAVNGKKLDNPDVLLDAIEEGKVGDTLTLSICHVNEDYSLNQFDIKVKLIEDKGSVEAQ